MRLDQLHVYAMVVANLCQAFEDECVCECNTHECSQCQLKRIVEKCRHELMLALKEQKANNL